MSTTTRRLLAVAAALVAVVPLTALGVHADPKRGQITEVAWVDGKLAAYWADFGLEPAARLRQPLFAVGPQDPAQPQEAPTDGRPDHDHVLPSIGYGQRARCHAWAVTASDGPLAYLVATRPSGLAYAVDMGDGFLPLTSYDVITAGLANGLLALSDVTISGAGIPDFTCWTVRGR